MLKPMNFVLKPMNFVLKPMNVVLKPMNCVLKPMDFARKCEGGAGEQGADAMEQAQRGGERRRGTAKVTPGTLLSLWVYCP